MYYITANGQNILDRYEYYSIELKGGGVLRSKFKLSISPYTSGDNSSKYRIEGDKLFETVTGLTNEYKFEDGIITLEQTVENVALVAKFKKPVVAT